MVHRIPYPPNKGDKIRSYHFLKGLADHYNVHLASFIDDLDDWQYVDKVENYVLSSKFIKLSPTVAKLKSVSGLVTQQALSVPYYHSKILQQWVDKTIAESKIDKVFVFSSVMYQYVKKYNNLDIIIDFVDVDSDKWLQYSQKAQWPMSWVYRREAKRLLEFDHNAAENSKISLFVSQDEAALFAQLLKLASGKIDFVNNGVDTDYFQHNKSFESPYQQEKVIVFTGAMDYWANVDAVLWFVEKVFPLVKQQNKNIQFYIVGSNPAKEVLNLANTEGVFVTGRVDDIRPYLVFSHVVVAPLLIARGIQNKVLEAMAMGKAVVASSQAIEGISLAQQEVYEANEPVRYAELVLESLNEGDAPYYSDINRQFVLKHYAWETSIRRLIQFIESD